MLSMKELMDKLEESFPDRASIMSGMSDKEKTAYIAQIELINTIKMWNEPHKEKKL